MNSNTKTDETTIEQTYYTFDHASLLSAGFVEINNNTIHIFFPDISPVPDKPTSNYKSVQLFVNDQLYFSFDWLPFFSIFDRYKIMDMFIKSYELFSNMIQGQYFVPFPHTNKSNCTHSSIVTQIQIPNQYTLYCSEDWKTTFIQITLDKNNPCVPGENEKDQPETEIYRDSPSNISEYPFHFQISIGENCVFNTERDFKQLHQHHVNCIVQFILHKLIHME